MANKVSWGEGIKPGMDASQIFLDPHKRLGAAVCLQAVKDFQDNNIIKALDALLFWLDDGPVWLDALGFEGDGPVEVLVKIAGGRYETRKIKRNCPEGSQGHDLPGNKKIPAGTGEGSSGIYKRKSPKSQAG